MNKFSRRNFLRLGTLSTIGAAVAACTPAPTATPAATKAVAPQQPVATAPPAASLKGTELLLWIDAQLAVEAAKKFLQATNQAWAQENGVKFREVETSGGMGGTEQVAAWMAAKQGPNLYLISDGGFVANAANLDEIGGLASEIGEKLGGWFDGPKSIATSYKGEWRGIPAWIFGQYWHYRTDLFKQAGFEKFPDTWDKLREAGKKLKKDLKFPIGFGLGPCGSDSHANAFSLFWSMGGKFFNKDGSIGVDTPESLAALEWFKGFWEDACLPEGIGWDCGGNNQAYNSKQISLTNNAISIYVGAKSKDPELANLTGLGAAPKGTAGAFHYQSQLISCIPSYAKDKATALAYLKSGLYDIKTQIALTKSGEGYNLPPFKALQGIDQAWPDDPKIAAARTLGEVTTSPGYAGPLTVAVGKMMAQNTFLDMFSSVAAGKRTPKEAITWVVGEMKRIMA